jgi:hypothetical protein
MVSADGPAEALRLAEAAAGLIRLDVRPVDEPAPMAIASS